jgi:hypothetical protein
MDQSLKQRTLGFAIGNFIRLYGNEIDRDANLRELPTPPPQIPTLSAFIRCDPDRNMAVVRGAGMRRAAVVEAGKGPAAAFAAADLWTRVSPPASPNAADRHSC